MSTTAEARRRAGAIATSVVLHAAVAFLMVFQSSRLFSLVSHDPIRALHRVELALSERSVRTAQAPRGAAQAASDELRAIRPPSALPIPGFAFDISKIAARATSLFPFLDFELSLTPSGAVDRHDEGGLVFFVADTTRAVSRPAPPLRLSDRAAQALVDATWARRDRWTPFRRLIRLAEQYSPDDGAVPRVLHGYMVQDLLQPYEDTSIPDPRLWTQLGIAADHADFLKFITGFVAEHPSTRAATDLLFLLDKLVQASEDSLMTLLDADPSTLWWTRAVNRDALRLVVDLRRYYIERFGNDASHRASLDRRFAAVRLRILRRIVETTPDQYGTADAQFLVGAVLWRDGRRSDAQKTWSAINTDGLSMYLENGVKVVQAIRDARGTETGQVPPAIVNSILAGEHERWLKTSTARIRRFGYRPDTY